MSSSSASPGSPAVRDVVIIGSGPAGLTAAIYTARANLGPLVIEGEPSSTGDQPGGQLMLTTEVENFPGFEHGIQGPELMTTMRAQAERFGAELRTAKVTKVAFSADPAEGPHRLWIGDEELHARSVIVATGARALMLGLEDEPRLLGHGLSTCATCDGFFFRGQHIAVVGGGDSALEEANFLTRFASKVTVIHRRDTLRASKIMQDRAMANPKIEFLWNHTVAALLGEQQLTGAVVRSTVDGTTSTLPVTGMFVAIGTSPTRTCSPASSTWTTPATSRPWAAPQPPTWPGLRLRRRAGPHLPPGDHLGRIGLHGRDRCRALARGPRARPRLTAPPSPGNKAGRCVLSTVSRISPLSQARPPGSASTTASSTRPPSQPPRAA